MANLDEVGPVSLTRRAALTDQTEQFRRMTEIRLFEERIVGLFSEGLVHGTTHTCQGQEALAVGIATSIRPTDTVCCTYRGHGMALALGMSPDAALGEIMGRQSGCIGGVGGSMHLSDPDIGLFPTFAIVGAGIPIGAGAALAYQVRGEDSVAVSVFGDGATNIGAFHEGLNLASIWRLPAVFVCDNNVYAEYSRIDKTTPIDELSVRATSYGIPSEVIDGMILDQVTVAMSRAVARARDGGGPTFIEAKTYRYAGHSRADAATYRPQGELEAWLPRDPVTVRRAELIASGVLSEETASVLESEVELEIERIVQRARDAAIPPLSAMFGNVWTSAAQPVSS